MRTTSWALPVLALLIAGPPAYAAPVVAAPAERHEIVLHPREPRPDHFVLAGRVKPDHRREPVVIQRRTCGGCGWRGYDRFDTDRDSRFRRVVEAPTERGDRVCYRVVVPGGGGFRRSVSEVVCIGPAG